jgi:prolipoprotein diacylglyceryltransferase
MGRLTIYSYGFMIAVGILGGLLTSTRLIGIPLPWNFRSDVLIF